VIEAVDVQYLKRHLHANNVVLFLGAGFSTAATNISGETLPGSRVLAAKLWEYMEYGTPYDGSQLGIVYQAALHKPGGQKNLVQLRRRWSHFCQSRHSSFRIRRPRRVYQSLGSDGGES
jgi:hypothetical protein